MAENGRQTEPGSGDGDSTGALWRVFRRLFQSDGDQSLRAQIEDVINEHDGDDDGAASGDLSPIERQMLRNLLHFSEHDADDVAIPRGEIIAIAASATWEEVVESFAEHGHSRMPVYGESLDEIRGMIHIKDVFPILARGGPAPADWTDLMRQPLYVPQSRGALDVLADMRAQRIHLAVVIDEYSGTDGIITIEDLVEEIVGEIEDEHDDAPEDLLGSGCPRRTGGSGRAHRSPAGRGRGSGRHPGRPRFRAGRTGAAGGQRAGARQRLADRGYRRK